MTMQDPNILKAFILLDRSVALPFNLLITIASISLCSIIEFYFFKSYRFSRFRSFLYSYCITFFMPSNGYTSIFDDVLIIALICLIAASLVVPNTLSINNNIFTLSNTAIAQSHPSSTSQFPINNLEFSTLRDKAGDPMQVSTGVFTADGNCEQCQFIKYIPGPIGKAGVAYRSAHTLDLTGAQRVVFFAKGELGEENVAFIAIGKRSNTTSVSPNIFTNLNFAVISKNVTLTNNWARYQLSLNGSDLTRVTDPFGFIISKVRSQVPSSNVPHIPLIDPNRNHITFFLKGVTFDNNPAVNPIPTVQLSSTNTTPTKAAPTNGLHTTGTTQTNGSLTFLLK